MQVELTEYPEGNQRFEILLGETLYVISLEEGKKLADLIYESHPTAKTENEALREIIQKRIPNAILPPSPMTTPELQVTDALLTKKDEGFFCQKCGTVYESEIMACRICNPKTYATLTQEMESDV